MSYVLYVVYSILHFKSYAVGLRGGCLVAVCLLFVFALAHRSGCFVIVVPPPRLVPGTVRVSFFPACNIAFWSQCRGHCWSEVRIPIVPPALELVLQWSSKCPGTDYHGVVLECSGCGPHVVLAFTHCAKRDSHKIFNAKACHRTAGTDCELRSHGKQTYR